jgi:cobalt/nickel transport system permease protein
MHMADALLSPVVGGAFWLASAALIGYSAKKITAEQDESKVPLMGVMGAFVFAAQMINFAIPGTGSSGHLGGGLLLTALLGPYRAFITLASVLTIQCLFFADGGLLALGCNIFNLAFFPAFIAYPLLFRPIAGAKPGKGRLLTASLVAGVIGLQLGAFSVVIETVLSGMSDLPFRTFVLFMQPIHLGIGVVEGLVTWGVISFVATIRPGVLEPTADSRRTFRPVLISLAVVTVMVGGLLSWFASADPDGLEWSIGKATGSEELAQKEQGLHARLAALQRKLAFLPDYGFKNTLPNEGQNGGSAVGGNAGTSVAGIVGSLLVLLVAVGLGYIFRKRNRSRQESTT